MKTQEGKYISKKNNFPKLSICVLIFKSEMRIQECIQSLINQTSHDFEIVLTNNASPDNSIKIASSMLRKAKDISFFVLNISKNTGCGQGRTKGYQNAHGKYVFNLDSDDTLPKNFVQEVTDKIIKEAPDIITFGHSIVDKSGSTIRTINAYTDPIFAKYALTMFWRYVFRKQLALDAKIDTSGMHYAEDRVFSLKLIPSIQKVSIINKSLYFYYKSAESTSSSFNPYIYYDSNIIVFRLYYSLLNSFKNNSKEYKCIRYMIIKFFVSILAKVAKNSRYTFYDLFYKYRSLIIYKGKNEFNKIFIIPQKNFSKEAFVIQTSFFLLNHHLIFIFRFVFKRFY